MGVRVDGAQRFESTLEAAGDELDHLTEGHRTTAVLIARAARPPRRTGRLAASIRPAPTAVAATVEATAAYAVPVHGGVPSRGIRAQPFLYRALVDTQNGWTDEYRTAVQAVLDTVKGD